MRKIRGFKLSLKLKEVQRRARKAKLDLAPLGMENGLDPRASVEARMAADAHGTPKLSAWLDRFAAAARPAVLYDSFPAEGKGAADGASKGLTSMPGLAYSLCLATLGPDLDAFREKAVAAEPAHAPLLDIAAEAALEEAVRFVLGLVEEEAREERCELSPIQFITDRAAVETVLARLEGHKIGVALGETELRPSRSLAFSVAWLAPRKSRAKAH